MEEVSQVMPLSGTSIGTKQAHTSADRVIGEDALLRQLSDPRSIDDILEAFVADGPPSAPPGMWGDKVGYSIYDEEEVLGRYMSLADVMEEVYGDILDELDFDEDDDEDWGAEEAAEEEEEEVGDDLYALRPGEMTRSARAIQPLCCVSCLDRDLPEACAICLECLVRPQSVWRLPCGHVFHETCALRFFAKVRAKATCPLCRSDIKRLLAGAP